MACIALLHSTDGLSTFSNKVFLSGFPVPPKTQRYDEYFGESITLYKLNNQDEIAQVRATLMHMLPVRVDLICGLMINHIFDENEPNRLNNYHRYRALFREVPSILQMNKKHFFEGTQETVATETDVEECIVRFTHYRIKTLGEILEKEE